MTTEHYKTDDGAWELRLETLVGGNDVWRVNDRATTARHYCDVKALLADRLKAVPPPDPDLAMAREMVKWDGVEMRVQHGGIGVGFGRSSDGLAHQMTRVLTVALRAARSDGYAAGVAEFRGKAVAAFELAAKNSLTAPTEGMYREGARLVRDLK